MEKEHLNKIKNNFKNNNKKQKAKKKKSKWNTTSEWVAKKYQETQQCKKSSRKERNLSNGIFKERIKKKTKSESMTE